MWAFVFLWKKVLPLRVAGTSCDSGVCKEIKKRTCVAFWKVGNLCAVYSSTAGRVNYGRVIRKVACLDKCGRRGRKTEKWYIQSCPRRKGAILFGRHRVSGLGYLRRYVSEKNYFFSPAAELGYEFVRVFAVDDCVDELFCWEAILSLYVIPKGTNIPYTLKILRLNVRSLQEWKLKRNCIQTIKYQLHTLQYNSKNNLTKGEKGRTNKLVVHTAYTIVTQQTIPYKKNILNLPYKFLTEVKKLLPQ